LTFKGHFYSKVPIGTPLKRRRKEKFRGILLKPIRLGKRGDLAERGPGSLFPPGISRGYKLGIF